MLAACSKQTYAQGLKPEMKPQNQTIFNPNDEPRPI